MAQALCAVFTGAQYHLCAADAGAIGATEKIPLHSASPLCVLTACSLSYAAREKCRYSWLNAATRSLEPMWWMTITGWFEKAKTYVGWSLADRSRIARLRRCIEPDLDAVLERLGRELARFKEAQPLMANVRFVQRLHSVLREWLSGLLEGSFDQDYVVRRSLFGHRLAEIDLSFEDIILLEELTRQELFRIAAEKLGNSPQGLSSTLHALDKALNLDLALIYTSYLELRDAEMERALLERFLAVTGFSRTLYENLADARGWRRSAG